jgi:hypothetical protein
MEKHVKKHFLLSMILFSLMLISCVNSSMASTVTPETTVQEKGLTILNEVVGLDLTKYAVTTNEVETSQQKSYLGVVPEEDVQYTLSSGDSEIETLNTFVNGKLQRMYVLENEGLPSLVNPLDGANAVEMAKRFLTDYQEYTTDSIYGTLGSMLDNVDADKNMTKTMGNVQLNVSAIDGSTTFKWTYTFNGVLASNKFVALGFDNGFFTVFVDNWHLYSIGSTNVGLSEDEAVAIALDTARQHSWSLQLDEDTLRNFDEKKISWAALIFDCSLGVPEARSEDSLMLYPVWCVGVTLDKWYGQLYGIQVDIWADTGEVRLVQEAWSTLPPPKEMPNAYIDFEQKNKVSNAELSSMMIVLPTVAITLMVIALVWTNKKKNLSSHKLLKRFTSKTGGVMLCALIATTLLIQITTVNATSRGAVIWGSESAGSPNSPYSLSWRKTNDEIYKQRDMASTISSYFSVNGYDGTGIGSINQQGSTGSERNDILSDLSTLQSNHDYVAVVDFDHGISGYPFIIFPTEEHYMFEDNTGTITGPADDKSYNHWENAVFDCDIRPRMQGQKLIFALINTCESANVDRLGQGWITTGWPVAPRALGLPFAWTGRLVNDRDMGGFNTAQHISDDGYDKPDNASQVYIGFPSGSAALMQRVPYENPTASQYHYWLEDFFWQALTFDISVNQALNYASWQWGHDFGASPYSTGFTSVWPMDLDGDGSFTDYFGYDCTMAVYGNGNIHLKQFEP